MILALLTDEEAAFARCHSGLGMVLAGGTACEAAHGAVAFGAATSVEAEELRQMVGASESFREQLHHLGKDLLFLSRTFLLREGQLIGFVLGLFLGLLLGVLKGIIRGADLSRLQC